MTPLSSLFPTKNVRVYNAPARLTANQAGWKGGDIVVQSGVVGGYYFQIQCYGITQIAAQDYQAMVTFPDAGPGTDGAQLDYVTLDWAGISIQYSDSGDGYDSSNVYVSTSGTSGTTIAQNFANAVSSGSTPWYLIGVDGNTVSVGDSSWNWGSISSYWASSGITQYSQQWGSAFELDINSANGEYTVTSEDTNNYTADQLAQMLGGVIAMLGSWNGDSVACSTDGNGLLTVSGTSTADDSWFDQFSLNAYDDNGVTGFQSPAVIASASPGYHAEAHPGVYVVTDPTQLDAAAGYVPFYASASANGSGNPDNTQPWPIGTLYVDTQANVLWMLESSGWVQIPFNPTVHYIYGGYGQVALKLDGMLDVMQSTTDWAVIRLYATGGSGTCANPWVVACIGDGTINPRGSFNISHTGSNRFWMEPGCSALHLATGGNVSNATFSVTTATGATTMDGGKVKTDGNGNLTSATHILTPQSAPASPTKGQIYFDTSSSHFFGWNGSAWKQLDN